jgi:hypothetical protein
MWHRRRLAFPGDGARCEWYALRSAPPTMRFARTLLRLAFLLPAGAAVAIACGGKTSVPSGGPPEPGSSSGSSTGGRSTSSSSSGGSSTSSGGTQAGCPAGLPGQYSQCSDVGLVCGAPPETCTCESPGTWACSGSGGSSGGSSGSSGGACTGLTGCAPIAGCNSTSVCKNVDGCNNTCTCYGTVWGCTDLACPQPPCPPQPTPGVQCPFGNQLCTWQDTQCACTQGTWTCIPNCPPPPSSCPAMQPAQYSPCYDVGLPCPYGGALCHCMAPGAWFCNEGAVDGG